MKKAAILLSSVFALAACGSGDAPTGQVAATVDGSEVTVSQINHELAASGVGADQSTPEIANRALDAIINRSILAAEARERGLDKTPAGSLALERAEEVALVQLLRADLQSNSPEPSDDEARQFISSNRAMFDDRFVSIVEQVVINSLPEDMMADLEETNTLAEVRALLEARGVDYQVTMGSVDSLTISPAIARQIVELGVGEVYIIPQGDGARVNAVVSRESYPIEGEEALELSRRMVSQQRSVGQAQSQFRALLDEKKTGVSYAEGYSAPEVPAGPEAAADGAGDGSDDTP